MFFIYFYLLLFAVGTIAVFVKFRTALNAEFCGGCCGLFFGSFSLFCFNLLFYRFADAGDIGRRKNVVSGIVAVLIFKFIVYRNNVLYKDYNHHKKLVNKADNYRSENHNKDSLAAEPLSVNNSEEHEESVKDYDCGCKDIECLQNLFNDKIFEITGVVQKFSESVKLFAAFFGHDKDKRKNGYDDCKNGCDNGQSTADGNITGKE